jgi:hypothetical protein
VKERGAPEDSPASAPGEAEGSARAALPQLVLHRHQDRRLRGGHPWIFSNEVERVIGSPEGGDLVEVVDARGATA